MDTIFINSKTVKYLVLIDYYLIFQGKTNIKISDKYIYLSKLSMHLSIYGKIYKNHTKTITLKFELQR